MPVQRFHDPDEARRALWVAPGDPALARRIRHLWEFSARLARAASPRGVRRFRTIEESNVDREVWMRERVRTLLTERARSTLR